ncbi:hypothetical protein K504DRAFT_468840 [Pleomassaria siparia CBS 279.74]|uniref:Uncharacterized protein n=1 Tax=Pleomassaria siparia CBS 279.74 TaxID=1314801 RepID=A0A6G1K7B0_9PLEO|nr:hypothetical protein K504DRAFT_468840 [Pleomassaria siparia CBS 279.74]
MFLPWRIPRRGLYVSGPSEAWRSYSLLHAAEECQLSRSTSQAARQSPSLWFVLAPVLPQCGASFKDEQLRRQRASEALFPDSPTRAATTMRRISSTLTSLGSCKTKVLSVCACASPQSGPRDSVPGMCQIECGRSATRLIITELFKKWGQGICVLLGQQVG